MDAAAFCALLHHVAAFTLAGALIAELALFDRDLTLRSAIRIQRADLAYGIAAGTVLAAGLLRVFFFEKGAEYYFHNMFFIVKMSLFLTVALLSIYPTVIFLSWNKHVKANVLPQVTDSQFRRVRVLYGS